VGRRSCQLRTRAHQDHGPESGNRSVRRTGAASGQENSARSVNRLIAFDRSPPSVISCGSRLRLFYSSIRTDPMSRAARILLAVLFVVFSAVLANKARSDEQTVFDKTKKEWLTILEKDEKPRMRKAAVIALGIFGPGQKEILPALTT